MHSRLLQLLRDNATPQPGALYLQASTDNTPAEMLLYDVIDPYFGISAMEINKAVLSLRGEPVTMRINSPGGDVFEGRAIATVVGEHGDVNVVIDGLCASAATTVATAAKTVSIGQGASYMIHNGWTYMYGDKNDCFKVGALLQKIDEAIAADYARITGASLEQVVAWMDGETWFSADEALAAGFVNSVIEPNSSAKTKNWNLSAYSNAPKNIIVAPPEPDHQHLRDACARRLRLLTPLT